MKKMTDNNSIYIKMKHIKELTNSERFEHAKSNTLRKKLKVKTLYYNKRLRFIIFILLCFFFFFFLGGSKWWRRKSNPNYTELLGKRPV